MNRSKRQACFLGDWIWLIFSAGHLRVIFDFGFERQELIFSDKHFALGQYHNILIRRKNSGATLVMEVSYLEFEFHFWSFEKLVFNWIQLTPV